MMKMRTFMTHSAMAVILATSTSALAHTNFTDSCNINFEGELSFKDEVLSITLENGDIAHFTPDGQIDINRDSLDLTAEQKADAQQYYSSITTAIPMTAEIAVDALEIASGAVTEAFGELLGYDDPLVNEFDDFFADLNTSVNEQFYAADGTFTMRSSDDNDGRWVSPAWESELENKIEDMVGKSIGRLLVAIGTEMVMGGGDMSAFEAKMENFGEQIEQRVEFQTDELEEKAENLCMTLSSADLAEAKLANSVKELSSLNMLDIENPRFKM
ncbi:DUF2884 family protein [Alteromonas flava]|uniref:DUF2884 family protein n=1 Tax=Alteromonas flava TaxID=2048003 RepID=UPI000C293DEB|nr:DUF2884 family protein [Alteromonas flava]